MHPCDRLHLQARVEKRLNEEDLQSEKISRGLQGRTALRRAHVLRAGEVQAGRLRLGVLQGDVGVSKRTKESKPAQRTRKKTATSGSSWKRATMFSFFPPASRRRKSMSCRVMADMRMLRLSCQHEKIRHLAVGSSLRDEGRRVSCQLGETTAAGSSPPDVRDVLDDEVALARERGHSVDGFDRGEKFAVDRAELDGRVEDESISEHLDVAIVVRAAVDVVFLTLMTVLDNLWVGAQRQSTARERSWTLRSTYLPIAATESTAA